MSHLWSKVKKNYKSIATNILIFVILVLFGFILYNIISGEKTIEGFNSPITNDAIFGNYINATEDGNKSTGEIVMKLGSVYRIEYIAINFGKKVVGNTSYTCTISYTNSGQTFVLNPPISIDLSNDNTRITLSGLKLLNQSGNKIYTDNLTFQFNDAINNNQIINLSTTSNLINYQDIKIYGMNIGDHDANFYNDSKLNSTFNIESTTTNNILSEQDPIDNSMQLHYFKIIGGTTNGDNDKLIKGINYNIINTVVPTTTTLLYRTINSITYINSKSNTRFMLMDKAGKNPQTFTLNKNTGTIYFNTPILANLLILQTSKGFTFTRANSSPTTNVFGKTPDDVEINTYAIPNYMIGKSIGEKCPSPDRISSDLALTQRICDDIENHDKIRMEQIKLEKEKQYLIKLKKQDDEITRLQSEISDIESNRKNRDSVLDNLRLAQFQKQREEAVKLRDAATEKIAQQGQRNLNLEVNLIEESA